MTLSELSGALQAVEDEVNTWSLPLWSQPDLDDAVAVWDQFDRLITNLAILRRDHATVLARRIHDEYSTGEVTVHRTLPKSEKWDGHGVLTALSESVIDANGEMIEAIPLEVARAVIPACGEGQTSSKWKMGALKQHIPNATQFRQVEWGEAQVGRGPAYVRNQTPSTDQTADEQGDPPDVNNSCT